MRLVLESFRRGCGIFDQNTIFLREVVHVRDCSVDLLDAGCLLLGGNLDFAHDVRHPLNAVNDIVHRLTGLISARLVINLDGKLILTPMLGALVVRVYKVTISVFGLQKTG